jgi:ADP-heptose:LPS heptosyltransferase
MKVMQILPRLEVGGVERGVLDVVSFFKDRALLGNSVDKDEKITNIVVSGGGRLVEQLNKKGITHYELPVYKKSLLSLFTIPKVERIIDNEGVNIVHARSRVPAWISFFASRQRSYFVTTAHGIYKNKFFSQVMGWGKFVICPSKTVARHMHKNFGVPQEKIVIINRWVDLKRFEFNSYESRKNSNVIVSVGRISPTKGYEYLIEGFKKVIRIHPYLILKIVGEADKSHFNYFCHLKTMVNRFSLNYNIQFLGYRSDVERILAEARILVAPSIIEESFGRIVVEAFASGVPVIATNIGAFKEIVEEGENGILVEPKSGRAIADAILRILGERRYPQRLVKKAREKVERFYSLENCLKEKGKLYIKTLNILRILVIKISSLGDVVLSVPSLKEIRERFPKAKIYLLTLKKYSSLFDRCPYIDEVIVVENDYKKLINILKISNYLRRHSFDYIVDLQNNHASHLIAFLAFPYKSLGYSLRWGKLLTKSAKLNFRDSPLTSQERVLSLIGIKLKTKKLTFWQPEEYKDKRLSTYKDIIGINISASLKWQSKNWPCKHIMNFIELIYKNFPSFKVILLGDSHAKEEAAKIENYLYPRPINYCGKVSLKELPSLISRLKVLVTPDTATLHLAVSLGVPTIALFGPTNPHRHTVKDKNLYILYKKLPCSFCYSGNCKIKERNKCMDKISPQEVFSFLYQICKR